METGIPVEAWWRGDERDLATALELMQDQRKQQQRPARRSEGVVTGG